MLGQVEASLQIRVLDLIVDSMLDSMLDLMLDSSAAAAVGLDEVDAHGFHVSNMADQLPSMVAKDVMIVFPAAAAAAPLRP